MRKIVFSLRRSAVGTALLLGFAGPLLAAPLFLAPYYAQDVGLPLSFLETVDLNGDSRSDLIGTTLSGGTVVVALARAGGGFDPPHAYGISAGGSKPTIGDLTGDG